MYNNDYILNLLNIKDKNISILPNFEEKIILNIKLFQLFLLIFLIIVHVVKSKIILLTISLNGALEKIVSLKYLKYQIAKQD
jgi:hypothetical protein